MSETDDLSLQKSAWLKKLTKELGTDEAEHALWREVEHMQVHAHPEPTPASLWGSRRETYLPDFSAANNWSAGIGLSLDAMELPKANKKALYALQCGADALRIQGIGISEPQEWLLLQKDIMPEVVQWHLDGGEANHTLAFMVPDLWAKNGLNTSVVQGSILHDPLSEMLSTGCSTIDDAEAFHSLTDAYLRHLKSALPLFKGLGVRAHNTVEFGGHTIVELASALSISAAYLQLADTQKKHWSRQLFWRLLAGTNFFVEIAKFRAARWVWQQLLKSYALPDVSLHLQAHVSGKCFTLFDKHNNLIRAAISAQAAAIGGADHIEIDPFDLHDTSLSNEGIRWSLNIQHLLKNESHLDVVPDAAAGAHYIESLTRDLAAKSWELFCDWEDRGGWAVLVKKGEIQQIINSVKQSQLMDIESGKQIKVGVNRYQHLAQTAQYLPPHPLPALLQEPEFETLTPFHPSLEVELLRSNQMRWKKAQLWTEDPGLLKEKTTIHFIQQLRSLGIDVQTHTVKSFAALPIDSTSLTIALLHHPSALEAIDQGKALFVFNACGQSPVEHSAVKATLHPGMQLRVIYDIITQD